MRSNRKLDIAVIIVMSCVVVLWLSTSTGKSRRGYGVETQVYTTPEYRTDAARAVDAYERLMERFMDMTERNLTNVASNIDRTDDKLATIAARLASIDARLGRIEKHLGIQPPALPVPPDPNDPPLPPLPSAGR
jgi:hypothetical protein